VNFEQFGGIKELQHMGGQKLLFQVFKCFFIDLLSIQKTTIFLGDPKMVSPFVIMFLQIFGTNWLGLGKIKFL
jgi:hypothetical protein